MVRRCIIRLAITVVVLGAVAPLSADEVGDFLSSIARDYKRRNCWPEPFIYSDRNLVRQTMAIQTSAGWERQNLLSDFHFQPGGNELTEAGRIQVQWIMNEAPEARRQIFVHRANTPQETAIRMQAVQRTSRNPPMPQILLCSNRLERTMVGRRIASIGWPARPWERRWTPNLWEIPTVATAPADTSPDYSW